MLSACVILRLALQIVHDPRLTALRTGLLALQIVLACWVALCGYHTTLGPLTLDPLTACWVVLWSLGQLASDRVCGPTGEACGALGLLCHNQALALICFIPCLIENHRRLPFRRLAKERGTDNRSFSAPAHRQQEKWPEKKPDGLWQSASWQLGLLAPAACCLAAAALFPQHVHGDALTGQGVTPDILSEVGSGVAANARLQGATSFDFLVPLATLALLPAFAAMPVLAYSLIVPSVIAQSGAFWPVSLVVIGGGLSLFLPLQRTLSLWPLLLLGLTQSARAGGLADCALAGSEAFILSLALHGLGGKAGFLQAPLPPLAGFLPFWLSLHVVNGLTGLSPAWTAGGMILSLAIGVLMVKAWLASWQALGGVSLPGTGLSLAGKGLQAGSMASTPLSFGLHKIPSLTLGLCLSVCPGLLLGFVHDAALIVAGAPQEIWRSWPVWSVAGGDGAFWYPALVFVVPALVAPAFISHIPALLTPVPFWPCVAPRIRLPWAARRLLAAGRRRFILTRQALLRQTGADPEKPDSTGFILLQPDMFLARHALVLWLLLIAIALSWLGWTG